MIWPKGLNPLVFNKQYLLYDMSYQSNIVFFSCYQAKRMDVVWGETAAERGQLWLLCPILFILQVVGKYALLL